MASQNLLRPIFYLDKLVRVLGLYQDGNQTWTYYIFGHLTHLLFMDYFFLGEIIYLFVAETWIERILILSIATTVICYMFKITTFFRKIKQIVDISEGLADLIAFSIDEEKYKNGVLIKKKVDLIEKVCKLYAIMLTVNAAFGVLVLIFFRVLPYKVFYPFNTETGSVGYYIAAIHQTVSCFHGSFFLLYIDMYPVSLMIYVTGLLQELKARLSFAGLDEDASLPELLHCVQIYDRIKKFTREIQNNFGAILFAQCTISSIVIGLSVFTVSIIEEQSTKVIISCYCLPVTFQIFMPCYFGNELMIASKEVMDSILAVKWFSRAKNEKKIKSTLMIFTENLKVSLIISFHGLMNINLITFTNIMHSSYSLLAVLNSVNR